MSNETIRPTGTILELLKGKVSESLTTTSYQDPLEPREVIVQLVEEGAGLAGLENPRDAVEWSGIFNHILISTRVAVNFAKQLKKSGYDINPQIVMEAGLVSHLGRRVWDEANWYQDAISDSLIKRNITNEEIGVRMLQGSSNISPEVIQTVKSLAHGHDVDPQSYEAIGYKLFSYVDHRTTDQAFEYHERMGNFLLGIFIDQESKTDELKENIYTMIKQVFENIQYGIEITLEQAVESAKQLGANENSPRLSLERFMTLILEDAQTNKTLQKAGIDVSTKSINSLPMLRWERYLRRLYLNDAERAAFVEISAIDEKIYDPVDFEHTLSGARESAFTNYDFNTEKWGFEAYEEIMKAQERRPYIPSRSETSTRSLTGWQRAIEFFAYLDQQEKSHQE